VLRFELPEALLAMTTHFDFDWLVATLEVAVMMACGSVSNGVAARRWFGVNGG
jgi:hypothetical protein